MHIVVNHEEGQGMDLPWLPYFRAGEGREGGGGGGGGGYVNKHLLSQYTLLTEQTILIDCISQA